MKHKKPIIICGPTASGKSAYALDLANNCNGVIINGDSMQIYHDLPIITAQPTQSEKDQIPHRLYSHLSGNDICSVARWRDLVLQEIELSHQQNLQPIIVGGTGLYLSALMNGITEIPEIPQEIRLKTRKMYSDLGAEGFYESLKEIDPITAKQLNQNDRQRSIRAYEVIVATGKTIHQWHQRDNQTTGIECEIQLIIRPRDELHKRAAYRFDHMLESGALEEVSQLLERSYDPSAPIMKALGVPELSTFLKKECSLEEAREKAIIATRQYIKRQSTWFRHQIPNARIVSLS